MSKKILFVITSHGELGSTGKKTGYWLSEVTHPWKVLKDAGYEIDFVSPKGGKCPYEGDDPDDPVNKEFAADSVYQNKINNSMKPEDVKPEDYVCIFYAGGHGAMWDFPTNQKLAEICSDIYVKGGVVAAVCHGPSGLINVKIPGGEYLIDGVHINGFTNAEERLIGLEKVVPFMLQTELEVRGGKFEYSDPWQPHVVSYERIITGQNPMSAKAVGEAIVYRLKQS